MKKEVKQKEVKAEDTEFGNLRYEEFFNNQLALSDELKKELKDAGLEWRFINATTFRSQGMHRSHWKPYNIVNKAVVGSLQGVSPEGIVTRGDLVLAVRPTAVANAHRKVLEQKNKAYKGFAKQKAEELRRDARSAGVAESVQITEGYDEN
jgi:hypothetical protein